MRRVSQGMESGEQGSRLEALLRRLRRGPPGPRGSEESRLDLSPGTAFEALLQERLRGVERGLDDLKGRLIGLLFLVTGAVIVQLILGLAR